MLVHGVITKELKKTEIEMSNRVSQGIKARPIKFLIFLLMCV